MGQTVRFGVLPDEKSIANGLISVKGVKHGRQVLTTTGEDL